MTLSDFIRSVPDFPNKGIIYRDITPLLLNPEAMRFCVERFIEELPDIKIDKVVGVEARGFFFATLLAQRLDVGLIPVRKTGKLPFDRFQAAYDLEYGKDPLEIHQDASKKGENVLIHDDVLATGGTAAATSQLVNQCGGNVIQYNFLLELKALKGREKIKDAPFIALLEY